MHILLVGSGAREHALGWKIAKSPLVRRLTVTPSGNPGLEAVATTSVDLATADIPDFAEKESVDLVVVGPEAPLAEGLADALEAREIPCFGPTKAAAQLETSKAFTRALCAEKGIPSPRYGQFTVAATAKDFLRTLSGPYVIKADGLAAGKGVLIAETLGEADGAVDAMLGGQFGAASETIVIEECLHGTELSVFAITDGETILPAGAAQDHKRAFDGNQGPNTGGMGGFSPSPLDTPALWDTIKADILQPTLEGLRERGTPYRGVFYAGLFITAEGPKLIEYNCRFGDPECQILMRRLRSDIVPALWGAATDRLGGIAFDWMPEAAANIVVASTGYPGTYEKGAAIERFTDAAAMDGVEIFHAGTKLEDGVLKAKGGRVVSVTALGDDLGQALDRAYAGAETLAWPNSFYRKDIGSAFRHG